MKYIKLLSYLISALLIALTGYYSYLVINNNPSNQVVNQAQVKQTLDRSIAWLISNKEHAVTTNNPILWWLIEESGKKLNNTDLLALVGEYRKRTLNDRSPWNLYFDKHHVNYSYIYGSLDILPDYNKLFMYGLSCDRELGNEDFIKKQLNTNFCNWKPYYSSCSTHHLMGIRLMQRNNCGDPVLSNQLADDLAYKISKLLYWDPRVGDVYIQRVLMLIESGNHDLVNPAWINHIMNHQRMDGGWASFDSILQINDELHFGFNYKYVDIRKPESSFHATAQAILLLSLLIEQKEVTLQQ